MAHTNSTTNYGLPQFVPTDKPAWLTDVNGAFYTIDTAIDAAKDTADNAQGDATQALTDASAASTAAATADAKGAGAVASIADAFDSTTVYSVGDYVMYNSLLYVCSADVITPGPWTGSANWTRVTVENIIDDINGSDIPVSSLDPTTVASAIGSLNTSVARTIYGTGANSIRFETFNNRFIITLFSNAAQTDGIRIDFNGQANAITLSILSSGQYTAINSIPFTHL